LNFEWNEAKNASNETKHGLSFERAILVFADPNRLTIVDLRHPGERRENTTGSVAGLLIATVTHTDRADVIRLISARLASRQEREIYHAKPR